MFEFKDRLQLLRALNKVSQGDFAKALNISRGAVSGYETGIRTPDIEVLKKTADFFGVSSDYLLGISDVKNTDTDLQGICKALNLSEKSVENLKSTKEKVVDLMLSSNEWNEYVDVVAQFLQGGKDIEYRKFIVTQRLIKMLEGMLK